MTKGEFRVGINFNPSGDDTVGKVKRAAADLIDMIEQIDVGSDEATGERQRLKAVAQTQIETAAMYGVKAATKQPAD